MGSQLLPPAEDNRRGFFEDVDILAFHERCLNRRGWNYLSIPYARIDLDENERAEARALIGARERRCPWGWKDPRTCLFLNAWYELLPDCRFVVVHRHPVQVLASLLRRGERVALTDCAAALHAWTIYLGGVLDFLTERRPDCIALDSHAFAAAPEQGRRLLAAIGIPVSPSVVRETMIADELKALPGLEELERLIDCVDPRILALHRRMHQRLDLQAPGRTACEPAIRARLRDLCRLAEQTAGAEDARELQHALLVTALSAVDPAVASRLRTFRAHTLETQHERLKADMDALIEGLSQAHDRCAGAARAASTGRTAVVTAPDQAGAERADDRADAGDQWPSNWAGVPAAVLQHRPWEELRIPVRPYPVTMLQQDELRYLYWLARDIVDPEGLIVELRAWQAGSTAVLAQAAMDRPPQRPPTRVVTFDRFVCSEYDDTFGGQRDLRPGDDMLPLFERNVAPWRACIQVVKTELADATWDPGQQISLLFVDAVKPPELVEKVWNTFGPALRQDAMVVFQDFMYHAFWFVPVLTALLPGLRPVHACRDGTSVGFRFSGPFARAQLPTLEPELANAQLRRICDAFAWDPPSRAALEFAWVNALLELGQLDPAVRRYQRIRDWPLCAGAADAPRLVGQHLNLAVRAARAADTRIAAPADALAGEALAEVPALPAETQALANGFREIYRRWVAADGAVEYYRRLLHGTEEASRSNYERALAAEASANANYERVLAAEVASKENYQRALAAEAAAEQNYQRALSAEAHSKQNYERALAAEEGAKANYERALGAEAASKQNYQRALAAEQAAQRNLERAVAAEAIQGSLRLQRDELSTQLSVAARRSRSLEAELQSLGGALAALHVQLRTMEAERNYYRRRWPPYAAKRAVQKLWDWGRRQVYRWRHRQALVGFGHQAQVCVLWTGLPHSSAEASVTALVEQQTRPVEQIILPGRCAALGSNGGIQNVLVHNWWAPDLPRLLRGLDFVMLMHPEYYGAGPLWNPLAVEALVAAMASDERLAAIALRGAPDGPRIGVPNHLHETDAATIWQWSESDLAAIFRVEALCEAFPPGNPGESREIRPTLVELLRRGRRVLVAPQTFPTGAEAAVAAAAEIGARLPAEPKAAIRALYVTQWLECGGADKGAVDLLTRVDPQVVDFSLLTTLASTHPWERRVRGFVREVVHEGAWLPLPPEKRFPAFLVEYVRRRNIGLIHIMHSFLGYDALPELKRALPGVRVLDQCHILEPRDNMEGGHPAYSSRRYKHLLDHRTVTSQWLKRYLMRAHGIPEKQISVIYTCVDDEHEFNPQRFARGRFRRRIGVPLESRVVLFIGRLHWQKRPWLFVRIAEQVQRRSDLDAYFVMVGPGEERPRMEALRAALPDPRRLILVGEVSDSGPVYRDADLLLMPSHHEGLAFVSFEAMAMRLPQIFSDVNGQSELITPETGILIPPQDEHACVQAGTQAVLELLTDEPRRRRMAEAGQRRIREHFGIHVMVQAYEQLYRGLMRGS